MSEFDGLQQTIDSLRRDVLSTMNLCEERIRIGKRCEERLTQVNADIQKYKTAYDELRNTMNFMTDKYSNIKNYLEEKKKVSLQALEEAVAIGGQLVPDADVEGLQLRVKDGRALLVTDNEQNVNKREGSAYRGILSVLLRYTFIQYQPDCTHMLILDEAFNTLSSATCVATREVLNKLKDDIIIVAIEQHGTIMEGIERVRYRAIKDENKVTRFVREDVV